ncbi:MAG: DUF6504 family protein [Chitinophagales bacterium]
MRLLDAPVEVRLGKAGRLNSFRWRGRWRTIREVIDAWRETGAWWDGEPEKTFLLVRTDAAGLFELYYTGQPGKEQAWQLYRIYD